MLAIFLAALLFGFAFNVSPQERRREKKKEEKKK